MRKVMHVTPRKTENGLNWAVKGEKTKRAVKILENKINAIEIGKQISKNSKLGQIIIHGKDGKIQTEYTYGQDPRNIKG